MAEDLKDAIKQNAEGPQRARGDSGEMEQHSMTDQIAADKYLASTDATKDPTKAFARVKIVSPGTV